MSRRRFAKYSKTELIRKLRSKLRNRCVKAYLFGSYARGEAHAESDVDLIVVADTSLHFFDRIRDYVDVVYDFAPTDLIIYTPDEFRKLKRVPNALIRHARREWVSLFE